MRRCLIAAAFIAVLPALGPAGCRPSPAKELVVSAASDLRFAFEELGQAFARKTGTPVVFNFGSTGQLAQQIERGAKVDVFAAANVSYVEALEKTGLILPGTTALYGRGFIVIWTPEDNALRLDRLEDLIQPGIRRVAIANPDHAPYGVAARQALQRSGLWEAVSSRLVLAENVNQAFHFARTGNVDVALVALSLAMAAGEGRWIRVGEHLHEPIDQALGVVAGTRLEQEARAFGRFVNSPEGRSVMSRHGFALPGESLP